MLGKTFSVRAIAALVGLPDNELEALLTSLVRKEVLGVQSDPRSPERGQYGFLQDLVRHVAYETLSKRERKTRHLDAAAHIEETFVHDEVAEVLASHYVAAYEAAPEADDAPAIRSKAEEMLSRAGERASSLGAPEEARRYYEQAAEWRTSRSCRRRPPSRRDGRPAPTAGSRAGATPSARSLPTRRLTVRVAWPAQRSARRSRRGAAAWTSAARLRRGPLELEQAGPSAEPRCLAQLGRVRALSGHAEEAWHRSSAHSACRSG